MGDEGLEYNVDKLHYKYKRRNYKNEKQNQKMSINSSTIIINIEDILKKNHQFPLYPPEFLLEKVDLVHEL